MVSSLLSFYQSEVSELLSHRQLILQCTELIVGTCQLLPADGLPYFKQFLEMEVVVSTFQREESLRMDVLKAIVQNEQMSKWIRAQCCVLFGTQPVMKAVIGSNSSQVCSVLAEVLQLLSFEKDAWTIVSKEVVSSQLIMDFLKQVAESGPQFLDLAQKSMQLGKQTLDNPEIINNWYQVARIMGIKHVDKEGY
eukprot:TRINITY_DN8611_c1_g1_i3.p2 TRINITY_DN8611_c1_g1~~TRINITY_DN8611_c1_g1_i3.p2  ORF type:complete len:210 (+),score=17.23 TRINITY_DN8611_c1_g1_i3:51-632(+)